MKTPAIRTFPLLAALLLGACSLQTAAPEKTVYQFGAARSASKTGAAQARFGLLRVQDFRVTQVNRTSSLVYRETDQRYVADPYRIFVAPPATLAAERTRAWLAASGLFRAVAPAGSLLAADLTLEGELAEFYIDVREPKAPTAVVVLRAWLVGRNDALVRPEWRFSKRIALDSPDAATAVAGFDRALAEALSDLEMTLAK
ncbi:ABC-type uncharacterized transport system, auxiliary component [Formivibrio citricus]|uniref:ABC-type uncharacterized transport system, auxiliary component n=1 Tax=Formivibrio citricus TaxID=83765 RepID=A0A1I5AR32_9NEIS|nr:ABC-type transport auxiliary lipoprotein family protein [Formivibrio citricus]SFN65006.1 ABC-type uncharacterized transport system, auxiliary component [Formivibrio citricus]